MTIVSIGHLIRDQRKKRGWRQSDLSTNLSHILGVEVPQATISRWETDRNRPPIEQPHFVKALAEVLNLTEADILAAAGFGVLTAVPANLPAEALEMIGKMTTEQIRALFDYIRLMLPAEHPDP